MILYRDERWLAVDKPTGLATHAGKPGELGAVEWLDLHRGWTSHVISRLDRGTSGVLLLARTPAQAARAQEIHEAGTARKIYEFLSGRDSAASGLPEEWERTDPLDDQEARTVFTRLGRSADGAWTHYRAEISRGRQHQVRRHAMLSGIPILGDEEYGGATGARLCLHCAEVVWPDLAAPLLAARPASFAALLGETDADPAVAVCHDRRTSWLADVTDAFRAVHRAEIPGLPVAIEVFGSWFNAVWFDEETTAAEQSRRLDPVLEQIRRTYGCRGGVVRTHRRNPHQRSLVAEVRVVGESPPDILTVTEHGLQYEINLLTTQHTGLFLDQRDSRRRLALRAKNARVANLFAFTCSFSVAAARHEAEVVFSVDTAKAALTTGKKNFAHNGLSAKGQGKFIQEDVRRYLARQLRKRDQDRGAWQGWDLVVCDPPVFASVKDGGKFSLMQEWPVLARQCADLMTPGAAAVFANNHRTGNHQAYTRALTAVFKSVTSLRPPLDFPVFPGRPHHVRTFWCE